MDLKNKDLQIAFEKAFEDYPDYDSQDEPRTGVKYQPNSNFRRDDPITIGNGSTFLFDLPDDKWYVIEWDGKDEDGEKYLGYETFEFESTAIHHAMSLIEQGTVKFYDVGILKYPVVVKVEARNEEEAKKKAQNSVKFSTFEIISCDEVEE